MRLAPWLLVLPDQADPALLMQQFNAASYPKKALPACQGFS
jgi:hypothetical protein